MSDLVSRADVFEVLMEQLDKTNEVVEAVGWQGASPTAPIMGLFTEMSKIPSAEPVQGWIPVTERLPEDEKSVLVTDGEGFVHMMHYEYIPQGGYWFTAEEGMLVEESDIIAWMPPPEPYKGGAV